jgi:spore maturation protein CgeB
MRITLTEEQEALLYKSTKLNLNFHERNNDLSQVNHLVNQRVFKIAGSGGLQLCDRVQAISDYFPNEEILTAGFDQDSWFGIIQDVVSNPSKYNEKRIQAMKTAHRYHTFQARVKSLIDLIDKKK